ncbi:MAG: type II toxin-antitoxin system RelE/ParE family toxin [Bacteroidales bacterium]
MKKFEIVILEPVWQFLKSLDKKAGTKIIFNMRKAQVTVDPELFKKLTDGIWEFRTKYKKNYYRLLAFWDKSDKKETLVVCAHGFIKKTKKIPKSDIEKAKLIMKKYFENGNK